MHRNSEALYQLSYGGSFNRSGICLIAFSFCRPLRFRHASLYGTMMSGDLGEIIETVRERVTPSDAEREALAATVETLLSRTEAAVDEAGVDADVVRVGSTSRDTWLRGDRDIDIFVRFDPSYDREDLERLGIDIGRAVLPDGRLEYAEHPYVKGTVDGYSIDLVPCFRVESGADIRSAVDRTPFHAAYVEERLDDSLATDVRVIKRFLEAIDVYGSDLRTEGFSGYLTELLVLEYGSAEAFLQRAAEWRPPVRLDPEDHGSATFADPLVVIDPTDPERNVAAVVIEENVARIQHYARNVVAEPTAEKFVPTAPEPMTRSELETHLARRATTPIAIRFRAPDVVEDQLYPQLRSSTRNLSNELYDRGFEPMRTASFAHEHGVLLFDLQVPSLPDIERHPGPPVHVEEHARAFLDRYADEQVYGPFIEGERYVVERPREVSTAAAFLQSDALLETGLGKDIRRTLADTYDVLVGEDILELLPEFGTDLREFYDPKP